MLACPQCSGNLVRQRTPNGVVYACNKCSGHMVGLSVLRKERAAQPFMRDVWRRARQGQPRQDRLCPHCKKHMAAVNAPVQDHSVALEVCTRCSCIWFDPGEYEETPRQAPPKARKKLSARAKEAIAMAEVERIQERADAAPDGGPPDEGWQVLPAIFGLPVECDVPGVRCWPWITWGLSAAAAVVFLVTWRDINAAASDWGFIPAFWARNGGATLLTSFFLHGGFWHLFSNAYFLLVFGDNVEDDLGRLRYAGLLLAAELLGAATHASVDPQSFRPCIGASAGISGVIAYYAVAFPHARIGFLWRYGIFYRWIRMSAWVAFALWLCLQFLVAWMQAEGFGNVSGLAHLGGAAAGLAMAFTVRYWRSAALRN